MSDARPIYLASRSPRRLELLRDHGFDDVRTIHADVDDGNLIAPTDNAIHWTIALAHLKARAGAEALEALDGAAPPPVVIGADTVVVKDGRIIGQPVDEDDARDIIRTLRDGAHDVITGVAIVDRDDVRLLWDRARVEVGPIDDDTIEDYLASGAWRGKAGAYNLRDRIDAGWPITFSGDPTTVMGLPMVVLGPTLSAIARRDHPYSLGDAPSRV